MKAPALDEVCLYLFKRYPRLFAAGFGDQAVPEILKPGSVFFEVDENRYLATFAIRDELDSSHGFILPQPPRSCPVPVAQALSILAPSQISRKLAGSLGQPKLRVQCGGGIFTEPHIELLRLDYPLLFGGTPELQFIFSEREMHGAFRTRL
jgi:hypothetical protein